MKNHPVMCSDLHGSVLRKLASSLMNGMQCFCLIMPSRVSGAAMRSVRLKKEINLDTTYTDRGYPYIARPLIQTRIDTLNLTSSVLDICDEGAYALVNTNY